MSYCASAPISRARPKTPDGTGTVATYSFVDVFPSASITIYLQNAKYHSADVARSHFHAFFANDHLPSAVVVGLSRGGTAVVTRNLYVALLLGYVGTGMADRRSRISGDSIAQTLSFN